MRVLIAEDDAVSRRLLTLNLQRWGYDVVETCDGAQAWEELSKADPPSIAILDWMMPRLDGVDLCRRIRVSGMKRPAYVILLTAKTQRQDIVEALEQGADDYVTKPFDATELKARVGAGARIVTLQAALADRVDELEAALAQIKQLRGLLPICMYCKRIRDDDDYWCQTEQYISAHSNAEFSHGICPTCYDTTIADLRERKRRRAASADAPEPIPPRAE